MSLFISIPSNADIVDFRWSKTLNRIHKRSTTLTIIRHGDIRVYMAAGTICTAAAVAGTFSIALAGSIFGVIPLSLTAGAGLTILSGCIIGKLDTQPMMIKSSEEVREDIHTLESQHAEQGLRLTKKEVAKYITEEVMRFGSRFCQSRAPQMNYEIAVFAAKDGLIQAVPSEICIESPQHEERDPFVDVHSIHSRSKTVYPPVLLETRHKRLFDKQNSVYYPHIIVTNVTCSPAPIQQIPADPVHPSTPRATPLATPMTTSPATPMSLHSNSRSSSNSDSTPSTPRNSIAP